MTMAAFPAARWIKHAHELNRAVAHDDDRRARLHARRIGRVPAGAEHVRSRMAEKGAAIIAEVASEPAEGMMSTPRFKSIGFMPAATNLRPSFMIEAASTGAVVVPSPARSFVFEATSRTI